VSGTPATSTGSGGTPAKAPSGLTPPSTEPAPTGASANDYGLGYGCGGCSGDPAGSDGGTGIGTSTGTGNPQPYPPDAAVDAGLAGSWQRGTLLLWLVFLGLAGRLRRRRR